MKLALPATVLAAILLVLMGPALAADPSLDLERLGTEKASRNPHIIRGQLQLGLHFTRQALLGLQTAPADQTPERLERTLYASYRQLRFAHSGVKLRQAAEKGPHKNPTLEIASQQLHKARINHLLRALNMTRRVSTSKSDIEGLMKHLEATVSLVEQVMDLI